ncbi:MAG: hypothetical protein P4M12_06605 [Gammaproteobacteria bacterium]|nr:hypothetical protein [Gammaproteobacteria bacterium]
MTTSRNYIIYLLAALVSVFLSYDGSLRGAVINPDGLCYLQSAEAMTTADFHTAMNVCGQAQWPLYSMLIYGLAAVTKISYISAAFTVNGLFTLISVLTFIYIVSLMGANRRTLWLAAVVILMAHEFNSVREYVIRDHGFWAFYLLSLAFMLRFYAKLNVVNAFMWSVSMMIAILFRIEGAVFLLLLPLAVWIYNELTFTQKLKAFLQLYLLPILTVVAVFAYVKYTATDVTAHLSRLSEIQFHLLHGVNKLIESYQASANALGQHVLSVFAARDANYVLFLLLSVWYVALVLTNLSIIYGLLVLYAWIKKTPKLSCAVLLVLMSYLLVNVIITSLFLVENMFLSKRYLIALSLILMLWVPFAIEYLIQHFQQRKWLLPLVAFLIFISSLGGFFNFGYSKAYIRHSGEWLAEHANKEAHIYSNDPQVMYYSHHFGNDIFVLAHNYSDISILEQGGWKKFDFIALHLDSKEKEKNARITTEIALTPVHVFANKRGDQVIIYQVKH